MIAIPMGTAGDYHLYPESQIKHIIVLKHMITLYLNNLQLYITDNSEEDSIYGTNTTFLSKKDFAHFKASILEGAIGFNSLLCSERRDRPDKIWLAGTDFVEDRNVRIGDGSPC